MKVLVINCGSSSIKYKLYNSKKNTVLAKGLIEKIGEKGSNVKNHRQGIKTIISEILKKRVIAGLEEIAVVGHRVVHGGETFKEPQVVNAAVLKKIKECSQLAPLHNPANLAGIVSCQNLLPDTPQVAVFDTAFHQSIPPYAYMYAIPREYYKRYKVRKYGFHGSSHQFVAKRAGEILKKPLDKLRLITCHLGNGCSITAIENGRSIDTSMGFTPLEGLIMGTRSGDIDTAAVFYIMKKEGLSLGDMDSILNKNSGLLGISGVSNDFRSIRKAKNSGNRFAGLAYSMFIYRIKKYIGSYYFILGKVDAVCLTGGIGENSRDVLGVIESDIKKLSGGKTKVLVIPTDEELMIAELTEKVLKKSKRR